MFTLLNSESLWTGNSMKRLSEIRETLAAEGIEYKVKTKNHLGQSAGVGGSMRGRMGSFGNSSELMYQYDVIVYKQDLEKAKYLINRH